MPYFNTDTEHFRHRSLASDGYYHNVFQRIAGKDKQLLIAFDPMELWNKGILVVVSNGNSDNYVAGTVTVEYTLHVPAQSGESFIYEADSLGGDVWRGNIYGTATNNTRQNAGSFSGLLRFDIETRISGLRIRTTAAGNDTFRVDVVTGKPIVWKSENE